MTCANRVVALLAAASLLALPEAAWSGRGGGNRGGARGAHSGHSHPHGNRGAFIGGGFFYASPYYNFYPPWAYLQQPRYVEYVEQFAGNPTPDTKEWIFCPDKVASYPVVTECPGGWQRVIPQDRARQQAVPHQER